jgi:hypothetical protein
MSKVATFLHGGDNMLARRASVDVIYQGVNITSEISNDLLSFGYTDNASGVADDISIELKDDTGKWITSWAPQKGDNISANIKTLNWRYDGDNQILKCGEYLVDDINYFGRPRTLSIGAISTPANTDFMSTPKSKTWELASVKKISQSIADASKLQLYYDTQYNPVIHFIEQSETSDVTFLYDICRKNGLALKVYSNKLVIFRESEYEAKKEVDTIYESDTKMWNAKTSFTNTGYDGCRVEYSDPLTGSFYEYLFIAPGKTGKKIYKVNEAVSSWSEAERLAKSTLRELNKKENQIFVTIPGNLLLVASNTVMISGFGIFDGKYYIDKVTHSLSNFETGLELHKVLEGY